MTLKTWEIEFLDEQSREMGLSLCDVMMAIKHPANPRFSLFHSIDRHWKDDCYIITCLKSADSFAHAMIAALLPYVKWTLEVNYGKVMKSQVPKWFKPAARIWAADTYWDPKEECVCNKSDEMLNVAMSDEDGLYWEVEVIKTLPAKRKKIKVDDESITDSVSVVKMAISLVKTRHTTSHWQNQIEATPPTKNTTTKDAQTVVSQVSMITQLTKQVSILQLAHNKINSKLNKLAEFIMAQSANNKTPSPSKRKAAGGLRGSPGDGSWWRSAAGNVQGSYMTGIVPTTKTNPPLDLSQTQTSMNTIRGHRKIDGATHWEKNNRTPFD